MTAQAATIINFKQRVAQARRAKQTPPKSFEQLKQRELAWLLYISTGYTANLHHALTVNAVTFNMKEKSAVMKLIHTVEAESEKIRTMMQSI